MAAMPWITPEDLKKYTDIKAVKERDDEKLEVDIYRAEQKVISITNNRFDDDEKFKEIPKPVRTATLLIAEAYAKNATERAKEKRLKGETFDDYSYTAESGEINIEDLDIYGLLSDYITESGGDTLLRIRKL
ncbi:protein YqbG [Porcincola intestinalis]|jgi:hypothetical protein|uniref:DUF3199 family protein n=1 Tax=Porcincola intestinalis TaxID=2606632 RepID=A0A6L5WZZ2_9FIRM|nr:DUF3199 family protein [Porcincola intestinalis]MDY5579962.1 DUF3199 family protein [Porcincola intestinalis]MSS13641.1 DUF3199 family protein [Porcincola intestinalis]